jgi:hypothetical protein
MTNCKPQLILLFCHSIANNLIHNLKKGGWRYRYYFAEAIYSRLQRHSLNHEIFKRHLITSDRQGNSEDIPCYLTTLLTAEVE